MLPHRLQERVRVAMEHVDVDERLLGEARDAVGHRRRKRIEVRTRLHLAQVLFRRRISDRADLGAATARRQESRNPEIDQIRKVAVVEQDVGGLDVPVHQSNLVRGVHGVGDLLFEAGFDAVEVLNGGFMLLNSTPIPSPSVECATVALHWKNSVLV